MLELDGLDYKQRANVAMDMLMRQSYIDKSSAASIIERSFDLRFSENYKHMSIKSMLKRFIANHPYSNTSAFCRFLLASCYSDTRQNKSSADEYILRSYENSVSKQKI